MNASKIITLVGAASLLVAVGCDQQAVFPRPVFYEAPVFSGIDVDNPAVTTQGLTVPVASVSTTATTRAAYPLTRAFDGVVNNNGWATEADVSSGDITVTFSADYDITEFRLWNDFGTSVGQGASDLTLTFKNAGGDTIGTVTGLVADELLQAPKAQANTLGPDTFVFPVILKSRSVTISILDNFNPDTDDTYDSLNIREMEFEGELSPPAANCVDPMIEGIELRTGLTERDETKWPVSDLCDAITGANDGFASSEDQNAGTIRAVFPGPTMIAGFSIWNDFGSAIGQGATDITVTYYDSFGTLLLTAGPFTPDSANQANYPVGDHFSHATVSTAKWADIEIGDNFADGAATGIQNSLNIREIRFAEAFPDTENCASPDFDTITLISGLTERDPGRWPANDMCDGVVNNDGYASEGDQEAGTIRLDLAAATDIYGIELYNDFGQSLTQGALDPVIEFYNANGFYTQLTLTTIAGNQGNNNGPDGAYAPNVESLIPGITRVDIVIPDNFEGGTGLVNSINLREFSICTTFPCP